MRSMKKIKGGELDPKVPLEPSTLFLPLLHKYVQLFCILRNMLKVNHIHQLCSNVVEVLVLETA